MGEVMVDELLSTSDTVIMENPGRWEIRVDDATEDEITRELPAMDEQKLLAVG